MTAIRTRFAPSPTGFLHLGGARTALFSWAYARKTGGAFVLRIEDTDVARSTPAAVQGILDAMSWLGLGYDEGPHYQMKRMDRYRAVVADMVERGLAYRCYMSTADLDALRARQMEAGAKPRYDGTWRPENVRAHGLVPPAGVQPVIRFRNPDGGSVAWDDRVKGRVEFANDELDDLVIARPDGTPTYNFCVVVDDIDMRITHVIRGDDHVNNTPRQINIFRALGHEPPVFAHVPTVLGEDGQKLSKRHGAVSVMEYETAGYLPEAMVNFLARLGWGHGDDEVFSPAQFVEWFELDAINPAPSRFNTDKLNWLNQEHMKRLDAAALGARLRPYLDRAGLDASRGPDPAEVAVLLRDRVHTLAEMADAAHYFYAAPHPSREKLAEHLTAQSRPAVEGIAMAFADLPWTKDAIGERLKSEAKKHGLKPPQLFMPLRMLVAGTTQTPSLDAVLALIPREAVRARIAAGLGL